MSNAKAIMEYSFLVVFANDGTIDEKELAMLEKLALEDNVVDEQEKRVLKNIFSRVDKETVTEKVWEEINRFMNKYEIK